MAQSRQTDALGRVLGGRYRLVAPLGVGASAQVFLADDVRLRRRVAVKMLHVALADDHDFLRRFQAEAQAAAALNHPHVMAVYDWGQDDVPYLVLEYLGGGSVRAMLDKGRRLSPAQALRVGLEAGRALEYAHSRGLVHRDIKPANLLFGEEGRLRIADFGLARALAEAAWTEPQGAVLGTARYAAPEQARGERLDGRADVYALALVLIEAVTGEVPFAGDTTIGTLMARVNQPIEVPEALGALRGPVERAGTADPEDRLDAHGFVTALLASARELAAPAPLPLAGTAATDPDVPLADPHPTAIPFAPVDADATAEVARPVAPVVFDDAVAQAGVGPVAPTAMEPVPSIAAYDPGAAERAIPWSPDPPRRRIWRGLGIAVLVLVLLAGLGAGGFFGYRALRPVPSYAVPPSLDNVPLAQAEATVGELQHHWKVRVEHGREDGSTKGNVISTRPAVGQKLQRGKQLVLVVSDGNTLVNVPVDLVGKTFDAAQAELGLVGLAASQTTDYSATVAAGSVIKVADGTPAQIEKHAAVPLVVSKGHAPVVIDDLSKSDPNAATQHLQGQGFKVALTNDYSTTIAKGLVIRTAPAAGTPAPYGSTVSVVVSQGPKPVPVPSIAGSLTLADATARLQAAGLVPGTVTGGALGIPIAYSPGSGTMVPQGSTVNIVLG